MDLSYEESEQSPIKSTKAMVAKMPTNLTPQIPTQPYTFILTQLEAGGAQNRVMQTAAELRARGFNTLVIYLYRKRTAFNGEPYLVLSERADIRGIIIAVLNLIRLLRKRGGVVVCNTAPANVIGCFASLIAGVSRRYSVQTQPPDKVSPAFRIMDKLFGLTGVYTGVLANSNWTATQFADYSTPYRQRMQVVRNGINLSVDERSSDECRIELGWGLKDKIAVSVGRLSPQKGHDWLLRAMIHAPDLHLKIVGDGELRKGLVELCVGLGIADRVEFLGEVESDAVKAAIRGADVFAFPSRWETFGLAGLEALAHGVPIVASDLPVLREVLDPDQLQGFVKFVRLDDEHGLAEGLQEAASSSSPAEQAVSVARAYCQQFSVAKHADRLISATSP